LPEFLVRVVAVSVVQRLEFGIIDFLEHAAHETEEQAP
jgi:hypothetical protein